MANFKPTPGKYRKIDVYVTLADNGKRVYLHSTAAYATLAQAKIGAALGFRKYPHGYYAYVYEDGDTRERPVDPFSLTAFFAEDRTMPNVNPATQYRKETREYHEDMSTRFFDACWNVYTRRVTCGAVDAPCCASDAIDAIEAIAEEKVNNPRSQFYIYG